MDNNSPVPMTPFDELVTSPELQIMKLMIPFAPARGRRTLAACVKFMELRETLRIFGNRYGDIRAQMFEEEDPLTPFDILNSFRPYLGPREASALDMVINLKEMMSVMEMMQNTPSSESSGKEGSSFNPADLLAGMLSPEQQEMFHMYSDMFFAGSAEHTPENPAASEEYTASAQKEKDTNMNLENEYEYNTRKGDDSDGRMDEQSSDKELRSGEAGTN